MVYQYTISIIAVFGTSMYVFCYGYSDRILDHSFRKTSAIYVPLLVIAASFSAVAIYAEELSVFVNLSMLATSFCAYMAGQRFANKRKNSACRDLVNIINGSNYYSGPSSF